MSCAPDAARDRFRRVVSRPRLNDGHPGNVGYSGCFARDAGPPGRTSPKCCHSGALRRTAPVPDADSASAMARIPLIQQMLSPANDRRRHRRFRASGELVAWQLPLLGLPADDQAVVRGRIQNISSGGLCGSMDRGIEVSRTLRAEVRFPRTAAAIPMVLRVRWLRNLNGQRYKVGLQFLP